MPGLIGWLHWGCDDEHDLTLRRKIFNTNLAAAVTAFSLTGLAVFYTFTPNAALHKMVFTHVLFLLAAITVPWLNRARHFGGARWTLFAVVTGVLTFTIWTATGSTLQSHWYFVLVALLVITVAPIDELVQIVTCIAVSLGLFLYCEFVGVAPAPELLSLDVSTARVLRAVHIAAIVGTVGLNFWISEYARSSYELRLWSLSQLDELTRLANRRRLEERLSDALIASRRTGQCGAVIFLDLDNFKPLNDTYGHAAGDLLLQEVGHRLTAAVRESDEVARFGGDEFVVMLTHLGVDASEASARARRIAEKIRTLLAAPYRVAVVESSGTEERTVEHRCSASLGMVLFTDRPVSCDLLLKQADSAMYLAKDAGRNRVVIYEATANTA